jgi:glucosamine--fructose-6-phosphate aminotransferase (isomerizing)
MLKNRVSVPQEQDCFYKLQSFFLSSETPIKSKIGILHSRYASNKGLFKNSYAHPHFDIKNRIALFHNGFIANQEDLQKQLKTISGGEADTDSQLIAMLIGLEMD